MEAKDFRRVVSQNKNLMQRILENYSISKLLEFRKFNKQVCEEIIPRCIKELKYSCYEDDDEKESKAKNYANPFYKNLKYASKVEIQYISGKEEDLKKIQDIAERNSETCTYLHLQFWGQPEEDYDPNVAKLYVEALRKFDKITTLKLHVEDEANFTSIISLINADDSFPWFHTVEIVKCYEARDFKGVEEL